MNCRNPADHYVTVVNDEFRHHELTVAEWAAKFHAYQQAQKKEEPIAQENSDNEGDTQSARTRSPLVAIELTKRYFMNLAFNPGILGTRVAMYTMLALMVGALFWNLGDRADLESIQSRTAVSFYCVVSLSFP